MDPTACFNRYLDALRTLDREEALEAAGDLQEWLAKGGFEPEWSSGERLRFFHWCKVNETALKSL